MLAQENLGTSSTSPNRVLWQLTDNIGSVRALANNAGAVASWSDVSGTHYAYANYAEFGLPDEATTQVASVFGTRYLFTGRERDSITGEQYNRRRWYDPEAKRWISEDPIMQLSGQTNWFVYLNNGPLDAIDPSGLQTITARQAPQIRSMPRSTPRAPIERDPREAGDYWRDRLNRNNTPPKKLVDKPTWDEEAAQKWPDFNANEAAKRTQGDLDLAEQFARWAGVSEKKIQDLLRFANIPCLGEAGNTPNGKEEAARKLRQLAADELRKAAAAGGAGQVPPSVPTANGFDEPEEDPLQAGLYGELQKVLPEGQQANHLNQDAAFNSVIPTTEGVAVGMRGNAFTDRGSPHYNFHQSLESFWNQYRPGGPFAGTRPTNAEYGQALQTALQAGGISPSQASNLSAWAARQRATYGLSETGLVPRIPGRTNQRQ